MVEQMTSRSLSLEIEIAQNLDGKHLLPRLRQSSKSTCHVAVDIEWILPYTTEDYGAWRVHISG